MARQYHLHAALHKSDLLLCRRVSHGSDSMTRRLGFVLLMLTALLGAPSAQAQAGGDVTGIWLTQAGDARVRVSKCGGGICGVIVWLRQPIDPATGKPA